MRPQPSPCSGGEESVILRTLLSLGFGNGLSNKPDSNGLEMHSIIFLIALQAKAEGSMACPRHVLLLASVYT